MNPFLKFIPKQTGILFVALVAILTFTNCTSIKSTSSGLENETYLMFVGQPSKYENGVTVTIDQNTSFNATVVKDNSALAKGTIYAISPGKHIIQVSYNQKLIYQKQVFVSSRETRKIYLP